MNWRPTHAYVPGQTQRHPEDTFDALKTGLDGIPTERLSDTLAWTGGLALLRNGYYWEAHEVLEPVWMACPPNSPERVMVQAVIQFANARLKGRMGQIPAMQRLDALSRDLAREAVGRACGKVLGLGEDLCNIMHESGEKIEDNAQ